jgi:hypothetical protein
MMFALTLPMASVRDLTLAPMGFKSALAAARAAVSRTGALPRLGWGGNPRFPKESSWSAGGGVFGWFRRRLWRGRGGRG